MKAKLEYVEVASYTEVVEIDEEKYRELEKDYIEKYNRTPYLQEEMSLEEYLKSVEHEILSEMDLEPSADDKFLENGEITHLEAELLKED